MLKKLLALGVGSISLLLLYVSVQSPKMNISRELLIKASPEAIFPFINSSRKANDWMPWSESDPQVVTVYSGPEEGLGSKSSWESPGKMGTGQAVVVESVLNQVVKTQLTYTKPMEMEQLAEVSLTPNPEGTFVRWSVSGNNNFIGRLVCVFMNMDKEVGGNFEKGLNKLKTLVEAN